MNSSHAIGLGFCLFDADKISFYYLLKIQESSKTKTRIQVSFLKKVAGGHRIHAVSSRSKKTK